MFNNFSLFNEAKQNFTITHEYLQSYRPSNYMGKGPNLQLFCIFWSLTADISMWNFQGLKRCWTSVKKCERIGFKPTPSVTVCARVWGDACIMFLIHPDVLQDAITLKTFRMWRKASLNVLNLSYVAVFSETNTWINGLQQRHYLLRYQHVWVEHRFEASLDRRHVVREAAGERRRDCWVRKVWHDRWGVKSEKHDVRKEWGENQVAEALGRKRKQMHHWHITTLHTRTPNVDHSSTENSPKHISTRLKSSVWVCTFDWLTVMWNIEQQTHFP